MARAHISISPKIFSPLLLLVLWEASVDLGWLDARLIAPPSLVFAELWRLTLSGQLFEALSISLLRVAGGFAIAAVGGILLGVFMARVRAVEIFSDPLVEALRPVSPLALFPLFILWFGIGETSKVFIIAFACCFPVILNTFVGVRAIDPAYFRASRSLGANAGEIMRTVVLPASLPHIFTGLRLAWGIALIVIIAAEMIGAVRGIGYMVLDSQQTFRIPRLFGSIVVIGVLGFITDHGFRLAMRLMLPWYNAEAQGLIKVEPFVFAGLRSRVIFGCGTVAQTGTEIERLGRRRALVLSTPNQKANAQTLCARLQGLAAGVFAGAVMHTPVEVTGKALTAFQANGADCLVALGGGSTIGLAKAIATRTGADQVVIPTTYAGSEMTDILGETAGGEKTTRRDASILPETVIYDVELTVTLPASLTVTSGLNAMAHAAEALYARDRNPIISLMASEAIRALCGALPTLARDANDRDARTLALYSAWLCGAALGGASMALHHKLCHTLGGSFDMPHSEAHAILLPHTIGFNSVEVPELLAPISTALGATPGVALFDFAASLGAPTKLKDFGLSESDLDRAAGLAVSNPYRNPRGFNRASIRALLQDAWEGRRPPQ